MSSIIDALKKSDNNRTNESGNSVNQIKFGDAPPATNRRGFWLLVALLLILAGGVFAWTQGWHHRAIGLAKGWFGSDQTNEIQTAQVEPISTTTDPEITAAEVTTVTATEQAGKLTPPKPNEVKAKSLAVEHDQTENDTKKEQELEVISSREAGPTTSDADNNKAKIDVIDEDESLTVMPSKSNDVTKQAISLEQQNRKDLEPTLKQDYLLIHQIDFEIRKNIPPIKLNIHIFDPDPENRMVILNGVKYATGDSIEDLIVVEEINQQGVVLAFEGTRFLIPK